MSEKQVNQPKKIKGVSMQHNNPAQFVELGKRFIKGYYTICNTKNYIELSKILTDRKKAPSVFRIQGKEMIGIQQILTCKKQLHGKSNIQFVPTQYDIVLSGSRQLNIMVIGQCQFKNGDTTATVPFTEYIDMCIGPQQTMCIKTSILTINDGVARPIIESGKEFIGLYYKCLNSRDFKSITSILKSYSKFSLQNTVFTGNENICKGLSTMFTKTNMMFSEIKFDTVNSGPERTNFLVTGIATFTNDGESVKKMFSEFIHVGRKKTNQCKKKKKKQLQNEEKNTDTTFWVQSTMFQLWK